jgi:hypothetical protein
MLAEVQSVGPAEESLAAIHGGSWLSTKGINGQSLGTGAGVLHGALHFRARGHHYRDDLWPIRSFE